MGIFNNLNIWSEQKQKRQFFNLMSDHITLCWFILYNVICCTFLINGLAFSSQPGKIIGVQIWWCRLEFFSSFPLKPFSSFWKRFFIFYLLLSLGEKANGYDKNEVVVERLFIKNFFALLKRIKVYEVRNNNLMMRNDLFFDGGGIAGRVWEPM